MEGEDHVVDCVFKVQVPLVCEGPGCGEALWYTEDRLVMFTSAINDDLLGWMAGSDKVYLNCEVKVLKDMFNIIIKSRIDEKDWPLW